MAASLSSKQFLIIINKCILLFLRYSKTVKADRFMETPVSPFFPTVFDADHCTDCEAH